MNMQLLRAISASEVHAYQRDGVVWLQNIIDPELARRLAAAIDQELLNPQGMTVDLTDMGLENSTNNTVQATSAEWGQKQQEMDQRFAVAQFLEGSVLVDPDVKVDETSRGHFVSCTSAWKRNAFISQLCQASPLPEVAATLMQSKKVWLYADQILVKPPGTREKTAWHHDLPYDHIDGSQVTAIRMPCDRETGEMGAVNYLRGSHRPRVTYKTNFFISNKASPHDDGMDIPLIDDHRHLYDIVQIEPAPGDLVVHDLHTLHGAGGNASNRTRRAATIRYAGDDVRFKWRPAAPPQDVGNKLRDGDSLDLDLDTFPLVWPRST